LGSMSPRNKINMNRQTPKQLVAWTRALESALARVTSHFIVRVSNGGDEDVVRWKQGE
jgi:hypothetical protein